MTQLDVMYQYGSAPSEAAIMALAQVRKVYGIRNLQINEAEKTIRVEYDATRLTEPIVHQLLRRSGARHPRARLTASTAATANCRCTCSKLNASSRKLKVDRSASISYSYLVASLQCAPVAQLDRAPGYEPVGRRFESFRAHHDSSSPSKFRLCPMLDGEPSNPAKILWIVV